MYCYRQVEYEEGVEFMKQYDIHFFFETSALNGTNIDLVRKLIKAFFYRVFLGVY